MDDDDCVPEYPCPMCGRRMIHKEYRDEIFGGSYLAEELTECPVGCYRYEFSYGRYDLKIGDRDWAWRYDESESDRIAREDEVSELLPVEQ